MLRRAQLCDHYSNYEVTFAVNFILPKTFNKQQKRGSSEIPSRKEADVSNEKISFKVSYTILKRKKKEKN